MVLPPPTTIIGWDCCVDSLDDYDFFSIVVAGNSGGVKEAKKKKKSVIAIAAERLWKIEIVS